MMIQVLVKDGFKVHHTDRKAPFGWRFFAAGWNWNSDHKQPKPADSALTAAELQQLHLNSKYGANQIEFKHQHQTPSMDNPYINHMFIQQFNTTIHYNMTPIQLD